jgi:hypothetical protein
MKDTMKDTMQQLEQTMSPSRRRYFSGAVSSFGEGRVCAAHECNTLLSRYNDAETCSVHDDDGAA